MGTSAGLRERRSAEYGCPGNQPRTIRIRYIMAFSCGTAAVVTCVPNGVKHLERNNGRAVTKEATTHPDDAIVRELRKNGICLFPQVNKELRKNTPVSRSLSVSPCRVHAAPQRFLSVRARRWLIPIVPGMKPQTYSGTARHVQRPIIPSSPPVPSARGCRYRPSRSVCIQSARRRPRVGPGWWGSRGGRCW